MDVIIVLFRPEVVSIGQETIENTSLCENISVRNIPATERPVWKRNGGLSTAEEMINWHIRRKIALRSDIIPEMGRGLIVWLFGLQVVSDGQVTIVAMTSQVKNFFPVWDSNSGLTHDIA